MAVAHDLGTEPQFAEDIRLVIWDLDETFWDGTLSEGGISYRQDHHELVIELAERGIISAICSKNDMAEIEPVLRKAGIWDFFVFPSIDWTPKGHRIRAMLQEIGLRAQSVLFLDDNPMNLAQAAHMNPGLNVAMPDVINSLASSDQLHGKADKGLTRLAQYKVKERKCAAQDEVQGDTVEFLRQSNVRVYIEYDVESHIDRAIELVNRTNQLNFTKNRLPDDPMAAREALLDLLARNTTDAGLIWVRDDFGDYGFIGFYLTRRRSNARNLHHFCFSCRTLNMYIEHWLYEFLGRPALDMDADVLSDPVNDPVCPDWITPAPIEKMQAEAEEPVIRFDHIFARGGCDLASLMHYFSLHSDTIIEEFNQPKNDQIFRRDHSAFLMPALETPLNAEQVSAAASLGYHEADFESEILTIPQENPLYFLSFWADSDIPVYRHKETDLHVPYWLFGAQQHDLIAREDLRAAVGATDRQRARLDVLVRDFEHLGLLSCDEMRNRYCSILDQLPPKAPVILILANERGPVHYQKPEAPPHPHHARLNVVLRSLVKDHSNVILIDPADHITGAQDMIDLNHFKRTVYHRMYRDVVQRLTDHVAPQSEVICDE